MKRIFACIVIGVILLGVSQFVAAQESYTTQELNPTELQINSDNTVQPTTQQVLKTKFIEGNPILMSVIALVFVLGLAFCIERIIYLTLSEVNTKKFIEDIDYALEKGDVGEAMNIARNTRGPIALMYYQGLMRIDQGIDVVEKSIVSCGGVQVGKLEKGCSWITLFIAMAPPLGFLGTVIGMIISFDKIYMVGNISPSVIAGGMKMALITTVFGLIVALILQVFYNYILSKIEGLTNDMEDSSITLLDMLIKYNLKYKN